LPQTRAALPLLLPPGHRWLLRTATPHPGLQRPYLQHSLPARSRATTRHPMSSPTLETPLTRLLGIDTPIMLAGMNGVSHSKLATAVTNGGGLGVIGGLTMSPDELRSQIKDIKDNLDDKNAPFGVDLAIPQIGGSARKTNHDYTHGNLPELIDVIVEEGATIFVCAVGVPPNWVVEKLHAGGVLIGNMVGHPQHVPKALAAGVDIIIAQGGEAGGHTGQVSTLVLIPQCVDLVRGHVSPLNGEPIQVVGAGGIFDGRGVAAALAMGATGVWVGTRFICAEESSAGPKHRRAVLSAQSTDTTQTLIFSGRPLRVYNSDYVRAWNEEHAAEIDELTGKGILPAAWDSEHHLVRGEEMKLEYIPDLMGQGAGAVSEVMPAADIISEMMEVACEILSSNATFVTTRAAATAPAGAAARL
jgi:NAD(P)H-dependent flavin oxidoreductase YrpB (nitropropane dioxygenase family)